MKTHRHYFTSAANVLTFGPFDMKEIGDCISDCGNPRFMTDLLLYHPGIIGADIGARSAESGEDPYAPFNAAISAYARVTDDANGGRYTYEENPWHNVYAHLVDVERHALDVLGLSRRIARAATSSTRRYWKVDHFDGPGLVRERDGAKPLYDGEVGDVLNWQRQLVNILRIAAPDAGVIVNANPTEVCLWCPPGKSAAVTDPARHLKYLLSLNIDGVQLEDPHKVHGGLIEPIGDFVLGLLQAAGKRLIVTPSKGAVVEDDFWTKLAETFPEQVYMTVYE